MLEQSWITQRYTDRQTDRDTDRGTNRDIQILETTVNYLLPTTHTQHPEVKTEKEAALSPNRKTKQLRQSTNVSSAGV